MEKRNYTYLSKNFDAKRVEEVLMYVSSRLNFKEICKMFRDICYDQVAYYNNDDCSQIYKDENRSKLNVEQSNRLQQKVSCFVDLFEQSITDKREFNEDYLKEKGM